MADRPHVVFIITDQQRFDTIAALGYPHVDTPHLDRLVNEGVTFTNQFITAASCAPARASLFTGHYPHTTGVLRNADLWRHSWVEDLTRSGYRCINVGKMHTYPYDTPLGFAERYVVENKDRYLEERWYFDEWDKGLRARGLVKQQREQYRERPDYRESLGAFLWELPEDLHSDNFVGDMAVWWLDTKPRSEDPLFLEIGFPGPHPPYDPTPGWAERYMDRDLPLLEVTQEELDNQPPPYRHMRQHNVEIDHDSVVHQLDPSPEARHRQRAYYLANVSMIDEKVGEIVDALDRNGYLDNCVVIFTSDHGDCLTDHGHSQKWTMYDTITRVPTIVWAPGRFGGGRTVDGLCQQMDLGPLILDLAGVELDRVVEARSLLPALEGDGSTWEPREYVFAEQARDGIMDGTDFVTMVRSRDWKLVHFLDEPWGQLFDLNADPDEVVNLWDSAEHADRKRELLAVLREWRIRSQFDTKDTFASWR